MRHGLGFGLRGAVADEFRMQIRRQESLEGSHTSDPRGQYISKKTFCESNEAASGVSSLRFASCASSERSEGSLSSERSFAALRMTKPDGLFFEMY